MRIRLDRDRCQGHGRCYALATELFDSDDEGYAVLLIGGGVPGVGGSEGALPLVHEVAARRAVDNCPEFAISIENDPGSIDE
jgi:ferredoxin